jgi:hypothetical protein
MADTDDGLAMSSSLGSVPNPDPTRRTIEQLLREIANARELIETKVSGNFATLAARIDGLSDSMKNHMIISDRHTDVAIRDTQAIIETRLGAMDKATNLFQTMAGEQLSQLKQLHQEKFDSISVQFAERDTRTEQTAAGVKIAVDAALQAAKEAVAEQNRSFALATGKSETATMKQIEAMALSIQTNNKGLDDKIADMKDRLTRIEGQAGRDPRVDSMDSRLTRIEGMDLGSRSRRDDMHMDRTEKSADSHTMWAFAAVALAAIAIVISLIHPSAPSLIAPAQPPLLQRNSSPAPATPGFGLRISGYE